MRAAAHETAPALREPRRSAPSHAPPSRRPPRSPPRRKSRRPAAQAPVPASALPAMSFYGSIADDELFDLVKKSDQFARLDKELFGSPLHLRVMHALQPTASGKATGLLSAIFTGGTLGLIPAVTNNSLMVTYEVRVHGRELVSYSYQRTFTRAVNIWAKDETHGLGKEGLEWLKSTATEFTTAAAIDRQARVTQEGIRALLRRALKATSRGRCSGTACGRWSLGRHPSVPGARCACHSRIRRWCCSGLRSWCAPDPPAAPRDSG